jgi:hypothetical protein
MPNATTPDGSRSRWRLALKLVIVGASLAGLVSVTGPQAAAHHCEGSGRIDREGGEVDYSCHGQTPDRDGSYQGWTEEEQWMAFCTYQPERPTNPLPLKVGLVEVRTTTGRLMSPERVEALGFDPTGTYKEFSASCHHTDTGDSAFGGFFFYTEVPPIDVEVIRDQVKARIDIDEPPVESNPSWTDRFTVVHIDTWLWVDAAYWVEEYETETVGFTTVEVWATPNQMVWDFSDGSTSGPCEGPGTPWTRYGPEPECSVIFSRSSAGEPNDAYSATSTVDWIFTWAVNGADQGEFGQPFLAETNFELQVGEIQAVGS